MMTSFKTLALAALLSAVAATPVFAQAAIQEPGEFAFYHPNLDVLNGARPSTPLRPKPAWHMGRGKAASSLNTGPTAASTAITATVIVGSEALKK